MHFGHGLSYDQENDSLEELRLKRELKRTKLDKRKLEIISFNKQFNESLQNMNTEKTKEINSKIFNRIKNIIGKGDLLILFDCNSPSYYDFENKLVKIKSKKMIKQLKSSDNCSEESDNLWHFHGNKSMISTFDFKTKNLSSSVLPFNQFMSFFKDLNLCDDFMKLMKHPAYFDDEYKKPTECLNDDLKERKNSKNDLPIRPVAPKFGFHPQMQHFQHQQFQQQQFNPWARFAQFQQFGCRPGGG